jgi:sporulation protein YlmC with PRC-barrel domain
MTSGNELRDLVGSTAYDRSGEKIGKVGQVYVDDDTGQPTWVTVQTGLFGTCESFVPVEGAELGAERITVAYDKATVKDAPYICEDTHLSPQEEEQLCRHYGVEYERQSQAAGTTGDPDRDRDGDGVCDGKGTTGFGRDPVGETPRDQALPGYVLACDADARRRQWKGQPDMSQRNTVVRSLHDLGLAAWFGGSLAGAVAINGAAADVPDEKQRLRVANAGWARWTPVNLVAIILHLVGATGLLLGNKGRVAAQQGVGASTTAKSAVTGAALAVTAYSRLLGRKLERAEGTPIEGGTDPGTDTPPDIARTQQQLAVCQWVVPALTGALVVLNAVHGEQQRPKQVAFGILAKLARVFPVRG